MLSEHNLFKRSRLFSQLSHKTKNPFSSPLQVIYYFSVPKNNVNFFQVRQYISCFFILSRSVRRLNSNKALLFIKALTQHIHKIFYPKARCRFLMSVFLLLFPANTFIGLDGTQSASSENKDNQQKKLTEKQFFSGLAWQCHLRYFLLTITAIRKLPNILTLVYRS